MRFFAILPLVYLASLQIWGREAEAAELIPVKQSEQDDPVIVIAAKMGRPQVVAQVLESGADPAEKDKNGNNALITAVGKQDIETVKVLLAHDSKGTFINDSVEKTGMTALILAAGFKNEELCEQLLSAGAQPNQPLVLGCGDEGERHGPPEGTTPLHVSAISGNLPITKMLLSAGAVPYAYDKAGNTALYHALDHGHEEVALALIEAGADPDDKANEKGVPPLVLASRKGFTSAVKLLLEKNADPGVTATNGDTALLSALSGGNPAIVELLINTGKALDKVNSQSKTPLMVASQFGQVKIVERLIAKGANIEIKDSKGKTALDGVKDKAGKSFSAIVEALEAAARSPGASNQEL